MLALPGGQAWLGSSREEEELGEEEVTTVSCAAQDLQLTSRF